jgi:hypothetical protein
MRDDCPVAPTGDLSLARRSPRDTGLAHPERLAAGWRREALWWLPVVCAAFYAVAALVSFHELITSIYVNSDAALAPVLGQAIGHVPAGSYISLGNHAWYEEWLFLLASRDLPAHRQLWELAPMLWSLFGLGILLWTARTALGAWSAALCGAALLCVGAFGRFCFMAINWHSLSIVHTVLVVGMLVWLVPRLRAISWRRLIGVAGGLGALSALPTASDSLFPFWALLPLVVAAAVAGRRFSPPARARLVVFTAVTLGVAVVGALALASVMRHAGITSRALPVALVASDMIGHNLKLLTEGFAFLAGGRLADQSVLGFASAALALIALLLVLDQVRRIVGKRSVRDGMADGQLVYVTFWITSLVGTSAVFVLTDAPKDALSGRYLLAAYAATAALLPLVAMRSLRMRPIVTVGVCLFALIAAYQLISRPFVVITSPSASVRLPGPGTATALASFARQEGVTYAYGGYWDAEELTWGTNFRVLVRPVRVCPSRSRPHALCYPQLGMISSWYAPRRGVRSLLVVDSLGTSYNGVLARDPALGMPLAARRLGYIEVYVYPYDIASRLAKPRCGFTWAHPC